ncbi:MAG: tetratricopeptide repeat protein [Bacteroidota bacterium]
MNRILFILPLLVIFLAGCGGSENKHIREGNSSYQDSSYSEAVSAYKKALETNPESQKAKFNLADAYYKLNQYNEAGELLKELILLAENDSAKLMQIYYNFGNTLLAASFDCGSKNATLTDSINNQQSLIDNQTNIVEKVNLGVALDSMITIQNSLISAKDTLLLASIDAYKKALRYDYHDMDAKYNLAYAMKFLPKNLSSNSSKQEKTEPTEFALKLKKQADSLVSIFKFSDAYDLLNSCLEKDTTIKTYNDFIQKLKDVKDIL